MNTLSIKECLRFGWQTFRARPWLFVGVGLIIVAVDIVSNIIELILGMVGQSDASLLIPAMLLSMIVSFAIAILLNMGLLSFGLRAHDNVAAARVKDLWAPRPFWKFVGASILVSIVVLVGLILIIVPGIIAAVLLAFAPYFVMDKGLGPIRAMKESVRITKGNRWKLFGLFLALIGINILGLIALVIGLLVSMPVTMLAAVHAYRTLSGSTPVAAAPAPAPEMPAASEAPAAA